ncbi:metallophosphoesterase family protein [Staphylococcus gallinarum]|uniref:metallophosphoesterase family protein n=1 Tax=Staphylococcus gallinarum TaxID=1293 RepID=UPI0030C60D18
MINTITRNDNETLAQYQFRLYENRAELGLSNEQIADLLNSEHGTEYDESKYRKEYQAYKNVWQDMIEEKNNSFLPEDYVNEIEEQRIELQKEKFKFRDQKREFNNTLRKMARLEHLQEYLKESVEIIQPVSLPIKQISPANIKEGMVVISDMHLGMQINSQFNVYNKEVAKQRLNKLKERTYQKIIKEDINTLHIASLGDQIHGLIHSTTRITSEENVIEQIISVSEYLKAFVQSFLDMGINVKFYNVVGNHSRAVANKNDSLGTSESFERLITTVLNTAFKEYSNYESIEDTEGFVIVNISGKNIVLAHGDLDRGANAITKLSQLLGIQIHYLITGHVHHHFIKEHGLTVQYGVGSMCGLDQYAISGRFSGRPSQLILTFNDNDIEEAITVYLD